MKLVNKVSKGIWARFLWNLFRNDLTRYIWIVLCGTIYGITIIIFGLMAKDYNNQEELVIQLDLEEVSRLETCYLSIGYIESLCSSSASKAGDKPL